MLIFVHIFKVYIHLFAKKPSSFVLLELIGDDFQFQLVILHVEYRDAVLDFHVNVSPIFGFQFLLDSIVNILHRKKREMNDEHVIRIVFLQALVQKAGHDARLERIIRESSGHRTSGVAAVLEEFPSGLFFGQGRRGRRRNVTPNPSIERDVQGLSPSAAPHVKR